MTHWCFGGILFINIQHNIIALHEFTYQLGIRFLYSQNTRISPNLFILFNDITYMLCLAIFVQQYNCIKHLKPIYLI